MVNPASTPRIVADGDLAANVASFARHLRAANLTPATQRAYLTGLDLLARFLTDAGMPTDVAAIRREHVEALITDQLERLSPASAANRYSSVRPFFNWLVEEGEIKASPMARMRKPKVPEHAPPILTDAELAAVLRACEGPSFDERRDAALVRVFLSTGARLSEVANLRWTPEVPETNDVDLDAGVMRVMGKGRRERMAFLSPKAVKALDRYLRLRARHRFVTLPWLWLGQEGRLAQSGITQVLRGRGRGRRRRSAASSPVPPHLRPRGAVGRHAGGRGHGPGRLAQPRDAVRYAKSAERERAIAAARRVNVGDRL